MATYQAMQDRVLRRVIDTPTAVQTEVPTLLNTVKRKLQTQHNFKVMEARQDFVTVVATRALGSMPTTFKEFRDKPYLVLDNRGKWQPLYFAANREGLLREVDDEAEGAPEFLIAGMPTNPQFTQWPIEVYPLPDGRADYVDQEYRVSIPYWGFVPDYTAAADTDWFSLHAEEYLVAQTTSMAFWLDWDEEKAAFWAQLAENERREVIKFDKMQRLGGVDTLVPHRDGVLSPLIRR